jgi:6-phosphofructokinase
LRCAVRGGVAEFRQQLWAQLIAAGVRENDQLVVLGDGAAWIDQTVAELFPHARRILDFFHVAEHLWEVAHARFGEGTAAAQRWMDAKLGQLKQGGWAQVCRALKQLRLTGAAAHTRDQTLGYLKRHATQLAYDEYQAAGLPIGSGAIEGTCKHLVTSRCKQAGMRWSTAGLDALLALRCQVLNEQFDTLLPPPKLKLVWDKAGAAQL